MEGCICIAGRINCEEKEFVCIWGDSYQTIGSCCIGLSSVLDIIMLFLLIIMLSRGNLIELEECCCIEPLYHAQTCASFLLYETCVYYRYYIFVRHCMSVQFPKVFKGEHFLIGIRWYWLYWWKFISYMIVLWGSSPRLHITLYSILKKSL